MSHGSYQSWESWPVFNCDTSFLFFFSCLPPYPPQEPRFLTIIQNLWKQKNPLISPSEYKPCRFSKTTAEFGRGETARLRKLQPKADTSPEWLGSQGEVIQRLWYKHSSQTHLWRPFNRTFNGRQWSSKTPVQFWENLKFYVKIHVTNSSVLWWTRFHLSVVQLRDCRVNKQH